MTKRTDAVSVPVNPTREQVLAGQAADPHAHHVTDIYVAMVSAATERATTHPAPQAAAEGVGSKFTLPLEQITTKWKTEWNAQGLRPDLCDAFFAFARALAAAAPERAAIQPADEAVQRYTNDGEGNMIENEDGVWCYYQDAQQNEPTVFTHAAALVAADMATGIAILEAGQQDEKVGQPAGEAKPFAYFVQPSGFGPFIECAPTQAGCFPAYRVALSGSGRVPS